MTEIILTPTEINELKTFTNEGFEYSIELDENYYTVRLSDVQLGEMYDMLIPHAENAVVFDIVNKLLKNAPNNIIKPIAINKI